MSVYLGKDRQNVTQMMTDAHVTVRHLTRRVEGAGHILHMDSLFSSPGIFDDLHTRAVNCCGTVKQNCKGMPGGFDNKTLKLKC
jgi:hypothetical protein